MAIPGPVRTEVCFRIPPLFLGPTFSTGLHVHTCNRGMEGTPTSWGSAPPLGYPGSPYFRVTTRQREYQFRSGSELWKAVFALTRSHRQNFHPQTDA